MQDEEKLVKRAFTAYQKAGGNQQPSFNECGVEEVDGATYVVLRNINGVLAVYQYKKDSLIGLTEWPKAIE